MEIRSFIKIFVLVIAAASCNEESSKASNSPSKLESFAVPANKKGSPYLDTLPIENVTINGISIDQITPISIKKISKITLTVEKGKDVTEFGQTIWYRGFTSDNKLTFIDFEGSSSNRLVFRRCIITDSTFKIMSPNIYVGASIDSIDVPFQKLKTAEIYFKGKEYGIGYVFIDTGSDRRINRIGIRYLNDDDEGDE
jgi:hypothetical protein